jgi:hypothetical protein
MLPVCFLDLNGEDETGNVGREVSLGSGCLERIHEDGMDRLIACPC